MCNPYVVFAIPDYLVKTLSALGMSLDKLAVIVANGDRSGNEYDTVGQGLYGESGKALMHELKQKLSSYDASDIAASNRLMAEVFGLSYYRFSSAVADDLKYDISGYFDIEDDAYRAFISRYSDNTKNIETIIMNKKETSTEEGLYETKAYDGVLFVILRKGFANFKMFNSLLFKRVLLERLISLMFSVYGEASLVKSLYFRQFISLI